MTNFLEFMKRNLIFILIILVLVITNTGMVVYMFTKQEPTVENVSIDCPEVIETKTEEKEEKPKIIVDIKGYVKNPGVYELNEGSIVNDLVKKAGGLKTGGTLDNINLSKRLNNEDMIFVLSKVELTRLNTKEESTKTTSTTSTTSKTEITEENTLKKVSLNNATKEELMTVSGIGEAKALSIIEYRSKTPFTKIEDVMNVSGIGEALFAKIKDFITI